MKETLNVQIPDSFAESLKMAAAETGQSENGFVIQAIEDMLEYETKEGCLSKEATVLQFP